jgi:transcriptional accessory protein Tex/SPT6
MDETTAVELLQKNYVIHNEYHRTAIEDALKRLLSPAVIREIRGDQSDAADDHGISVFSQNLKNLLMQQPIKGTREVQELVSAVIAENNLEVLYTVVDEDGASVYSASDIARHGLTPKIVNLSGQGKLKPRQPVT